MHLYLCASAVNSSYITAAVMLVPAARHITGFYECTRSDTFYSCNLRLFVVFVCLFVVYFLTKCEKFSGQRAFVVI